MIRVGCAPTGTKLPAQTDLAFTLYGRPTPSVGGVGAMVPQAVEAMSLKPTARAWDFLSIALAVVAADEGCTRATSPDGWTRDINLTVAVVDASFWASVAGELQDALRFVTGDIWTLEFIDNGYLPKPPAQVKTRPEDIVCLLSGGMDSLIGAIDSIAAGHAPFLVSQISKGDKSNQRRFAQTIAPGCLHLQVNHNAKPPGGHSERSQRGRSLVFFGLGALAATCLASYENAPSIDLLVPENGFISLNVPLTPLRLGSLSTRTTHPFYLKKLQSVFDLAGLRVTLRNPYQYKTKGEMLCDCQNQSTLRMLVSDTTSCGRYARSGFQQCGRCVPCLVRRAAFLRWGVADPTPTYKYGAIGKRGEKFRDFDDVRSVAVAIHTVRTRGLKHWIGGTLNAAQIDQLDAARGVVERGLGELEVLLTEQGVL